LILRGFYSFWFNNQLMPNFVIAGEASDRGDLTWFRFDAAPASPAEQSIKTPSAGSLRGYVQENETEQDRRHALVLHRPRTIRCVRLPICNCHHAGQNESDCPREQTEHDRDATKEFQHSADTRLRQQRRRAWLAGHAAKPHQTESVRQPAKTKHPLRLAVKDT
jgi:hypothetical protein